MLWIKKQYTSDTEIVSKAMQGDRHAFKKIMDLYEGSLYKTAVAILGNRQEAEDIVQEVFLRFYRNIGQYKGEASLKTYLTKIGINLALNQLKKRKNEAWKSAEVPLVPKDESVSPYKSIDNKILIQKALQLLPEEFRTVITLRLIEGYSVKETASMLQIPQGTVLSRLARGQKKLREIIITLQK